MSTKKTTKKAAPKKTAAKKPAAKKTVKATVRKPAKKTAEATKLPPVVPFNKANVLALADEIYSDKAGEVKFLKLCDGHLSNGKDGGRTLHCAVGEAYFNFVNRDVKRAGGDTEFAIDSLIEVAQFADASKDRNEDILRDALDSAVEANDDSDPGLNEDDDKYDLLSYLARSKEVSDIFRHQIAPLLK